MSREIPTEAGITEAATDWFVRLRSETVTQGEVKQFNQWLREREAHREAFHRVDMFWLASKALSQSSAVQNSRATIARLKTEAAAELAQQQKFPTAQDNQNYRAVVANFNTQRFTRRGFATAAALLCAIAIGWYTITRTASPEPERYYTEVGESKTITLSDGSLFTLNTRSTVDVYFTESSRQLTLIRGQASFAVAKDKSRPFTVTAGSSTVTALGTEFDIYKTEQETTVTLLEGKVVVVPIAHEETGKTQTALQLTAGQQVQVSASGELSPVNTVNLEQARAWQGGKLNFDETPLSQVITEANRYTEFKLELGDSTIADLPITGIFTAGESEALATTLAVFHDLSLKPVGSHKLVLLPKNESG
jgi:transmembrane sensor